MCQAIAARKRRRVRRPSCSRGHVLSAVLAMLLLLFDACDGYMSTMHLGRTLKALRAREQQQQQQQGEQQQHGSLPPGAPASPSPDQRSDAEEIREDSHDRAAAPAAREQDFAPEGTAAVATHPSWGGAPGATSTGGEESTDPQGKATTIPAANEEPESLGADEEAGDVAGENEDMGLLEEQQGFKLSTSPVAAAAAAAAGVGVGGLASISHETEGTAAGADGTLEPGSSSSSSEIPADLHFSASDAAAEVVGVDDGGAGSTTAAAFGTTATATATATAAGVAPPVQQQGGELEEDEGRCEEGLLSEEEEDEEQEQGQQEEEAPEAVALREILSRRAARDLEVQAAAARAVEALPTTQRECFDEVKAFAFGAEGEGGGGGGGELSPEDVAALETVAICGDRDGVVLAFLRHSKFDVGKAKESMRRCCEWRREHADGIFQRAVSPAKMRKHRTHWPTGFHKEDRAGRPVFYDRVGQSDLNKLRADPDGLDQDEMVQIFTQNMEARRRFVLTRLSREVGRPVDQMTTVLDLTGLGMRHMSKEAVSYTRRISDVFQDNYSGMTCSLLILNAPWVFSKGWQVIESFLSEDTVAKVKVLGKGEAGLAQLEEYIPKENIPEFLGGESPAVIGPADPLWTDVDGAVRSWASGGDPFLDQAEVDRVSGRIRSEREQALRAASSKSKSKSKPKAEPKAGELLRGKEEKKATQEEVGEGRFAPAAVGQEQAPPVAADGGGGGGRRTRVRASRRAAVAAGGRAKSYGSGSAGGGGRRSKSRRQLPEAAEEADTPARADRGKAKERKKKHRRQRGGLVSSSATAAAAGRPSSSSYSSSSRRRAQPPPSSSLPSALQETVGSPSRRRGGGGRKDRGRSPKDGKRKKRVTWEDEEELTGTEDDEVEERAATGDNGAVGERVLDGLFAGGVVPVLRAWLSQLVAGLLAAGRVLLGAAEAVFRFLRDAFFEQVEVED